MYYLNKSHDSLKSHDNTLKISKLDGADLDDLVGLKKKKTKIRGDRG